MKVEAYINDDGLRCPRYRLEPSDIPDRVGIIITGGPAGFAGIEGARYRERICGIFGCRWEYKDGGAVWVHRCGGWLDPGCLDAPDLMPAGGARSGGPAYATHGFMIECFREPGHLLEKLQEEEDEDRETWGPLFGLSA